MAPLLLGLASFGLCGCGVSQPVSSSFVAGDTTGVIWVVTRDRAVLTDAHEIARGTLERVKHMLDLEDPGSEIARINRVAGTSRLPLSTSTFRLLDLALHYSEMTSGAYDITLAPLREIWGLLGDEIPAEPPPGDVIEETLKGVGNANVRLLNNGSIALVSPQVRIDVNSLINGYAMDQAIVQWRRDEVSGALFNMADRTIRCAGTAGKQLPWDASLVNPMDPTGRLGMVVLEDGNSLTTTLLFEPSVTIGDQRYGHIIDPRTGKPAAGIAGASVLGPSATEASILAQALVVLGVEKGNSILGYFPRCDVLMVPDRHPMELWMTEGFAARLRLDPAWSNAVHILERPAEVKDEESPAAAP